MEIIDLHDLDSSDISMRLELTQKIVNTLSRDGFIQISNHGIDEEIITNIFNSSNSFFNQSTSEKMKAVHMDKARRGYAAISTENFATLVGESGKPNDTVEKFRIGPLNEEESLLNNSIEANTWTGVPIDFKENLSKYYKSMESLTLRLLKIFAVAFDLDQDFFIEKMNAHSSILTLNHYPDLPLDSETMRVAEHTDVSMITIVAQSSPGLQILSTEEWQETGEKIWIDIPYIPGALVVNIGDCLADWSDGRLRSTRHRVVIPSSSSSNSISNSYCRSSLAYFVTPRYDALLSHWSSTEERNNTDVVMNTDAAPTFSEWRKRRIARAIKMLKTNPVIWKSK